MKRAIYTGSFDPVTNGHIDVIARASTMFDELTVVVMHNVSKSALFSDEERVKMLKEAVKEFDNVRLDSYCGLVSDYAKAHDIHVVIRGLRAVTDFEYELQMAQTNYMLSDKSLDTVFLTTAIEYSYLSSSGVKQIAYFGGDVSQCVPDFVADALRKKYKQ